MSHQDTLNIQDLKFRWTPQSKKIFKVPAFKISQGEMIFIQGKSGTGKSTLLNLISGILKAQEGNLQVLGASLHEMSGAQRDRFRASCISVIFQQFNLIPFLSVEENVLMADFFSSRKIALTKVHETLEALGISSSLFKKRVSEISVGQQQRVAVARSLVKASKLILADEPSSSLDEENTQDFMELFIAQAKEQKSSVLFVSHDLRLKKYFDRSLEIEDIVEWHSE